MPQTPTPENLMERINALEKELATYRVLVDSSPDLLYRTDLTGRIIYISPSVFKLSGYTVEEAIGMKMAEEAYLYPEERQAFLTQLQENGQVSNFQARLKRKDGSIWWASTNAHFYKHPDGTIAGVEGVTRDITGLKAAEQDLRDSEARLKALSEASFEAVFLSEKGICLDQNLTAERMFGYSHAEAVGRPGTDWIVPEYRERVKARMLAGYEEPYEAIALRKDGTTFPCEIQARMTVHQGRTIRMTALRDISQQTRIKEDLRTSEERFRNVYDTAPLAFVLWDKKGRITDWNKKAEAIFGWSKAEVMGQNFFDFMIPEKDRPLVSGIVASLMEGALSNQAVNDNLTKDGRVITCEWNNSLLHDDDGIIIGALSLGLDITARAHSEEALRESEEKYRRIFENSVVGFFQSSPAGRFIRVNAAFAQMLRYDSPDDLVAGITDIATQYYLNPADRQRYMEIIKREGKIENYEFQAKCKDGTRLWVSNSTRATYDSFGKILHYEGIVIDITQRKIAEQELRDLNETMALAQKMAGIGYWGYNIKTNRRVWSRQMFTVYGFEPQPDPPGMEALEKIWHPDDWDAYLNGFRGALAGTPYNIEVRVFFPDGQTHYIDTTGHPRYDEAGNIIGLYGTSRDITAQKQAHAALKDSEEQFRILVERSPFGISLIGRDGRYKYVNPRFTEMFGYTLEEVPTGIDWFNRAFPDEAGRREALSAWIEWRPQPVVGYAKSQTFKVTCLDGSVKDIHFTPVIRKNREQIVIYEDITARLQMEQQLLQTQKLEAIGTLAGGIAHDFNNLLMGIQGRASLMVADLTAPDPQKEHLDAIEAYIRSATDLTKQLLGFSRGGKYEVKPLDITDHMLNTAAMFQRTRKEIQVHNKTRAQPIVVEADKRQIEQVLLNIFINAWQAMPAGGELYLESQVVTLDEATSATLQLKIGDYALLSISDTGSGMDDNVRQQIFDPFFTTKHKSRGTGLGLASAYGIIKNHGGIITVDSTIGQGSTFNIYLPLSARAPHREIPAETELLTGSESILLVDDENMILEVGAAMLEKLGYRVMVAEGGQQAIEIMSATEGKIDLVILDMIMPGMDGGQTFDQLRKHQPQIPVILSSGYAMDSRAAEIIERGCNGFIQKPFNLPELSKKIHEILKATSRAGQV